jgi:hypothetical protein
MNPTTTKMHQNSKINIIIPQKNTQNSFDPKFPISSQDLNIFEENLRKLRRSRQQTEEIKPIRLEKFIRGCKESYFENPLINKFSKMLLQTNKEVILIDEFLDEEVTIYVLSYIPQMINLKTLILNNIKIGNHLFYEKFCEAIIPLNNLKTLSLSNCGLDTQMDISKLSLGLSCLSNLKILNLSDNKLSVIELSSIFKFEYNDDFNNEKNNPNISKSMNTDFNLFRYISRLKILNISLNSSQPPMKDPNSIYFTNRTLGFFYFSDLNMLRELHMVGLEIGEKVEIKYFRKAIARLDQIKLLDLSMNKLNDYCIKLIFSRKKSEFIERNRLLEELYLSSNLISNQGFDYLVNEFSNFKSIKVICLDRNQIFSLSSSADSRSIPKTLITLNLSENNFDILHFKATINFLCTYFRTVTKLFLKQCGLTGEHLKIILNKSEGFSKDLHFDLRENLFDASEIELIKSNKANIERFKKFLLYPYTKNELTRYIKKSCLSSKLI